VKLKLHNIRRLGRRINPATGRPVNIFMADDAAGWPRYFYLYRQERQWVGEDVWKWKKGHRFP